MESDETGSKLLLAVLSMIQGHYLFIAFGPRFERPMGYNYVAGMQGGQTLMRMSQNALILMVGIVLIINEFRHELLPILTFSTTGTLFVFNVVFLFVVTK